MEGDTLVLGSFLLDDRKQSGTPTRVSRSLNWAGSSSSATHQTTKSLYLFVSTLPRLCEGSRKCRGKLFIDGRSLYEYNYLSPFKEDIQKLCPTKVKRPVFSLKGLMVQDGEQKAVQSAGGSEDGSVLRGPERKPPVCL